MKTGGENSFAARLVAELPAYGRCNKVRQMLLFPFELMCYPTRERTQQLVGYLHNSISRGCGNQWSYIDDLAFHRYHLLGLENALAGGISLRCYVETR